MTNWSTINPNQLIPASVVNAVSTITDALASTLSSLADALSLPSLPSLPSAPNPTAAVVKAILDAIASILEGGRIHMIVIPIAKTIPARPPPALPPTLDDLQSALAITLGPTDSTTNDAYANLVAKAGGNAGFYTAFAESLTDPQDPNRPQYDGQTDAIAATILLVGAARFAEITSAASMFDMLVAPKGPNGPIARTIPVPQNLQARVAGPSAAPGVGVRLDWDVPRTKFASPYFPGVSMLPNRYAVIRSTDPKAQSARSVLDFFSTQTLTVGMTEGKAKVVAIGSGKNSAYLDLDASLDPKVPAYYCVAWEISATEAGKASTLPFDRVSNVAKVAVVAPSPPQTGTSPDWIASPSVLDLFPAVARVAQIVSEEASVLLAPSDSSSDRLGKAMALASDAATRISARAVDLMNDVKRLSASFSRAIPSLYVTQMSSSSGGNAFLLAELAKRLNDPTDPSRPPFDNGEYVCGVCLVAGAPRLADLAAQLAFFEALFSPAAAPNPLMGLLAAIDTAVTQAEAAVFGPDMRPLPTGTTGIDPTTGQPTAPTLPVTAADGTPVATLDPQNPNAGDTNVVPTSELC